jgi:hypothetical protein
MLVAMASAGPASHRPMPVITWRCHASGHPTGESRVAAAATAAPTPHSRGRLVPWRTAITPGAIQEHALVPALQAPREGTPMPDTTTTIAGNLTDNPELRHTEASIA